VGEEGTPAEKERMKTSEGVLGTTSMVSLYRGRGEATIIGTLRNRRRILCCAGTTLEDTTKSGNRRRRGKRGSSYLKKLFFSVQENRPLPPSMMDREKQDFQKEKGEMGV